MRLARAFALLVFAFLILPCADAQSPADLATLNDLKTASKQMKLESEGVPSFRLEATYATFDFMGRPENKGSWLEEFADMHAKRTTVHDGGSPELYAPEDQARIGSPAPAVSATFMQRFLLDAMLYPGPTDALLNTSKLSYKTQKVGAVTLRCVVLEPKEKAVNVYLARVASRIYCLSQDAPVIRLTQLSFGLVVSYNNLTNYGGHTFARQVSASQRGHNRGTLTVTKFTGAPELLQADLPKTDSSEEGGDPQFGPIKMDGKLMGNNVISKSQPAYPMEAKRQHVSGPVFLHVIIGREGTIESVEVISAPSDDLAESAIEAVSQWRYRPYLRNGVPTEVDTVVTVNYAFG